MIGSVPSLSVLLVTLFLLVLPSSFLVCLVSVSQLFSQFRAKFVLCYDNNSGLINFCFVVWLLHLLAAQN